MNLITWLRNNAKDIFFFVGLSMAVWLVSLIGRNSPVSALLITWRWILLIMVLFVILASWLITGNPLFGWLINEQNRVSLSRLQMFLWTVVILSAFVTAVLANLRFQHFQTAVSIAIPEELWLALGISTTSLVGSALILESKKNRDPKDLKALDEGERLEGLLVVENKPSLLDLIRGEEQDNHDIIDLTRLQNLLFTFVLVGMYMASLGAMFAKLITATPEVQDIANNFPIASFPELGSGAITLLTISHAGYLAAKAIDKQPSEPSGSGGSDIVAQG